MSQYGRNGAAQGHKRQYQIAASPLQDDLFLTLANDDASKSQASITGVNGRRRKVCSVISVSRRSRNINQYNL